MHIRPALTAALLAVVALGTAACDPESAGGDASAQGPAASAPAAPTGSPSAARPSGKASAPAGTASATAEGKRPDCKTYFASHKVIHVTALDQASGKITANNVAANCTDNGVFFNTANTTTSYTVSPEASVTVYHNQDMELKTVTAKSGTAADGLAHVKTCAETPHLTDFDKLPAGYFCNQDMYEITVNAQGVITSLKETYSS
ncbi:hypothetical protein [Kitasatospora camelliae]|uniref:Uncharacterized protein n=1 Tax=Kitasatospora camelliae TaxID=3156397 RepID=A0AAU8K3L9_9ACTN